MSILEVGALLRLKGVVFCLSVVCIPDLVAQGTPPHRIHVKEDVEKAKLLQSVSPIYPPLTGKRVDGTVVLHVLIGTDGAVKRAKYVSGPETCGLYAVEAVLQWRYEPMLMNGASVEVDTTVSVVFSPPDK